MENQAVVGRANTPELAGDLDYQSGFGNHFSSESIAGALPRDQNNPLVCPFGLYAEQISGTSFTSPRKLNQRRYLRFRLSSTEDSTRSVWEENFTFLLTIGLCGWLDLKLVVSDQAVGYARAVQAPRASSRAAAEWVWAVQHMRYSDAAAVEASGDTWVASGFCGWFVHDLWCWEFVSSPWIRYSHVILLNCEILLHLSLFKKFLTRCSVFLKIFTPIFLQINRKKVILFTFLVQ